MVTASWTCSFGTGQFASTFKGTPSGPARFWLALTAFRRFRSRTRSVTVAPKASGNRVVAHLVENEDARGQQKASLDVVVP
jgi:hypothetical protein